MPNDPVSCVHILHSVKSQPTCGHYSVEFLTSNLRHKSTTKTKEETKNAEEHYHYINFGMFHLFN